MLYCLLIHVVVVTQLLSPVLFAAEEPDMLTCIMRLRHLLTELIEPFDLLERLLSLQLLTGGHYITICSGDNATEDQNDLLLDLLISEDQCVMFLEALQQTDQQHVVNFITQHGGQRHDDFFTTRLVNVTCASFHWQNPGKSLQD